MRAILHSRIAMKWLLAMLLAGGFAGRAQAAQGGVVGFNREIRPILSENCFRCHGPDEKKRKSGLRLDLREEALRPAKSGARAIVPGKTEESELVKRISSTDVEEAMPPHDSGKKLSAAQVALLKRWVEEGAVYETHWAFIPPQRGEVPKVGRADWGKNPVDNFILARLERDGISPSPVADRTTLIRRLSLDLLGLPPSRAEVETFLHDDRADAYEQLVERLLASPHYGERWGRHWLDVARYADSNGYSIDAPRHIWKYRDWVIEALNRDMPYDQFVLEQLAGDMLPHASLEQRIATGFHRNTQINQEGGIDKEQFRIESIIDRVNTTGTAFFGLTVGCCQCHDHKFDPLTQKEYYGLFAFLNNADEPDLPLASAQDVARANQIEAQVEAYLEALPEKDPAIYDRMVAWEQSLTPAQRQAQTQAVRESFDVQFPVRPREKRLIVLAAFVDQAAENKEHREAIKKLRSAKPTVLTTMAMRELDKPRRSYLFINGDFTRDGGTIEPGTPAALHSFPKGGTTNRLDLARWIVDPRNPLLARVAVNRMWQEYFGKGLVATENDFGTQGSPPTHPELLDWLAVEFMHPSSKNAVPWSLKNIHRLIVNSATYRQSSRARPDLAERDPDNKLLARQGRLRLDAEVVRDVILSASGLLQERVGGPSVFPPQPDGVMKLGQSQRAWNANAGPDRYRRGLYTFYWRATPHPALAVFDAPDAFSACTRRIRSNTPLQALTLLNDQQFYELARGFTDRVLREGGENDPARLDYAFQLCLARTPSLAERRILEKLLAQGRRESGGGAQGKAEFEAWTNVSRALLNLDEMITRE